MLEEKSSKEDWLIKAWKYCKEEKYDEVIKCCEQAIIIDRYFREAWFLKGVALERLGKSHEAKKCYEDVSDLKQCWIDLGNQYKADDLYDKAIECYDRAIESDPKCEEAWFTKGTVFEKLGKFGEAKECYTHVSSIELCWYKLGKGYVKYGEFEEAIKCFNRAIDLDPNFVGAYKDKALVFIDLGMPDKAKECFRSIPLRAILVGMLIEFVGLVLGGFLGLLGFGGIGGILGFVVGGIGFIIFCLAINGLWCYILLIKNRF